MAKKWSTWFKDDRDPRVQFHFQEEYIAFVMVTRGH